MSKDLDKALGLPSNIEQWGNKLPTIVEEEQLSNDEEIVEDTKTARGGLYEALEKSQEAVNDMLEIAQSSQHPKAYEALNAAIKTLADISMNLADLQLKKQRLNGNTSRGEGGDNQTVNNLFVGSTAELQKMIEDMKK